jgi:trimethylamine:corrinoid methyltransferase-like protein
MFAQTGLRGEFLKLKETRQLFRTEQHIPSAVIDRTTLRSWEEAGSHDTTARARTRVDQLLASYQRPVLGAKREAALRAVVEPEARQCGLERLPAI